MTDKEQIIIDGVDVSRCEFYIKNYKYSCNLSFINKEKLCNCNEIERCYFKQLARKTQECEKLKKECDYLKRRVKGEIHLGNNYKKDFAEQVTETNRYRKALEEIEEVCVNQNLKFDTTACEILDIINKAKGEGNE